MKKTSFATKKSHIMAAYGLAVLMQIKYMCSVALSIMLDATRIDVKGGRAHAICG